MIYETNQSIFNSSTSINVSVNFTGFNTLNYARCDITKAGSVPSVAYSVFMTLLLTASVVGNLMVILAIIMSTQLKSRITFHFIVSLACSDLLLSIFLIPFKISDQLYDHQFCHDLSACYVYLISDAFGNVASILNLFLIAVDRFIAIKIPFRYIELVSASRAKFMISFVWMFSAFWSFTGIFQWSKTGRLSIAVERQCHNDNYFFYAASVFGVYLPVLVIITCTYLTILHVAVVQIRAIEATQVSFPKSDHRLLNDGNITPNTARKISRSKRTLHRELKATKAVAIVYLAFVVCWLPSCVINIIILFDNVYFPTINRNNPQLFLFIYYLFIQILPTANTMVNPLIYSFSNKQFRKAFKNIWMKLIRKKTTFKRSGTAVSYTASMSLINNSPSRSPKRSPRPKQSVVFLDESKASLA